jgi:hypothetical protein
LKLILSIFSIVSNQGGLGGLNKVAVTNYGKTPLRKVKIIAPCKISETLAYFYEIVSAYYCLQTHLKNK